MADGERTHNSVTSSRTISATSRRAFNDLAANTTNAREVARGVDLEGR